MSRSLQKDTLSFQFGVRPGVQARDVGAASIPKVAERIAAAKTSGDDIGELLCADPIGEKVMGHPELDAVIFYMMNHAMSLVRQRVHPLARLGDYLPLVEEYHRQLAIRSTRMFMYLVLICTRESRHDKSSGTNWYGGYPMSFLKLHKSIKGNGSDAAAMEFLNNPPAGTLGNYTRFLVDAFYKGSYSGGYGGKAWGEVAKVLHGFVTGTLSAEMMLDTAFTLCHNNGPIFNKGMFYSGYSKEIYRILDVQRSGQIPQLVADQATPWHSNAQVAALYKKCLSLLGPAFSGYVDWYLVEELGSMHSYPNEKTMQVSNHGYPSAFKAKLEVEELKKKMAAEKAAQEAAEQSKKYLEIWPGLTVQKVSSGRNV